MEDKLYQNVVEYIKEEIKQDRLRIGDKLPTERELSLTLNMGRNSIREALRTLSSLGMIESRQGSGNYLTGDISRFFAESFEVLTIVNKTNPLEISQMRRALETEALRQLIGKITQEQVQELQEIADHIELREEHHRSYSDLEFHQKLIELSGNSLMMATSSALSAVFQSNVTENLRILSAEEQKKTHLCHQELVEALRNGSFASGYQAISIHYDIVDASFCTLAENNQ